METLLYFIVSAALFFLMMRFGCGAHIMGHGHRHHERHGTGQDRYNSRWVHPDTAWDPVCRMSVGTSWAQSALYQGRVYYFCTAKCRDAFEAEPDRYIGAKADPSPKSME